MRNLKTTAKKLGYTYSEHQANSGSKYYRINGIKFRVSNHVQPSHYQARQYFDVHSEREIVNIISNNFFGKTFNPAQIDGKYYEMKYVESRDGFDRVELSKQEFNKLTTLKAKQKEFYKENGWTGEIY